MTNLMIRGLGHRRSVMLKSYFVEHILLTFLKYVFLKKWIYAVKSNYFKITPPTSVCFIFQVNIMHEYTETESKYTGKIGTHNIWEQMFITVEEVRLKKFEIKKNKHNFYVNNHSPNIFSVLANFCLFQNKIPCVFPIWKK